jgi:hypothetical protein
LLQALEGAYDGTAQAGTGGAQEGKRAGDIDVNTGWQT